MRTPILSLMLLAACSSPKPEPVSTPQQDPDAIASAAVAKMQSPLPSQAQVDATKAAAAPTPSPPDDRQKCADTRATRARNAIGSAKAETDLILKVLQRCKLTKTNTGAVNVQKTGSGARVAPEVREGVSCPKGLPAGVSEEQAAIIVSQMQPGAVRPAVAQLSDEDENTRCQRFDRDAGLNLQVLSTDVAGITKIAEWKP